MLSAKRALRRAKETGSPLPDLPELYDLYNGFYKLRLRRGQQTVIGGHSGSQKSGFAIWLVGQWAKNHGLSALYVSADMDQHTAMTRLVASLTGHSTDTVAAGLNADADGFYDDLMGEVPVRFMFEPNPTLVDVKHEINAWVEMWDAYPDIIVLDNLMDIVPTAGDTEFSGYKSILLDGKTITRETGAAVFTLHHMSETGTDPTVPAPKKSLMGKVSQTPENILSVALDHDRFKVAVVKQRNGPCDAAAQQVETLRVIPDRNRFERYVDIKAPPIVTWRSEEEDD